MPQVTLMNKFGKITGWNNVKMHFLGRDIEGIMDFSYDDNVKKDNEYGSGKYVLGQSDGNYEAKVSFTLYSEELVAILKSLPKGVRIQDIPPFPIVVVYELNGVIMKDVVQNVSFTNAGKEFKQNEGKGVFKFNPITSHIDWNV